MDYYGSKNSNCTKKKIIIDKRWHYFITNYITPKHNNVLNGLTFCTKPNYFKQTLGIIRDNI